MQCGGRPPGPGQDTPYVDIYNEKPVRVATKVVVPTKQHPKVRKMSGLSLKMTRGVIIFNKALVKRALKNEV